MSFFKILSLLILPASLLFSCSSAPSPYEEQVNISYDEIVWQLFKIRYKSEQIMPDTLKKFSKKELTDLNEYFDPMELIDLFPLLRLKPGTRLVYIYEGSPYRDGIGRVVVMENGKPLLLNSTGVYHRYVDFERTPAGYFQYVLLCEELGLLTLKQHMNYSQTWFIPSHESFLRICSDKDKYPEMASWYKSLLPGLPGDERYDNFWQQLRQADSSLRPRIEMDGSLVKIAICRFSPFGGVYSAEYIVDKKTGGIMQTSGEWSFPVNRRTEKYIVPFFCGVMF